MIIILVMIRKRGDDREGDLSRVLLDEWDVVFNVFFGVYG